MKPTFKLLSCIFMLFSLSACSLTPKDSNTNVEWQQHNQQLSQIESFQASGKMGYRGPDESVTLNFHWKQTPNKSELRLLNVLGSTVLTMSMTPDKATVVTKDNTLFEDKDANVLFAKLTGMTFPVSQMKDWIKGQPTDADSYSFNQTNTLESLTKSSAGQLWFLTYNRYQDVEQLPMPYQMTLQKSDTKIKIVVSKWVLN